MTPSDAPGKKAFWNVTSNFSFTHSVFYPFRELSDIFIKFKIVICRLFQFGPVLNLLFRNGLMSRSAIWNFH